MGLPNLDLPNCHDCNAKPGEMHMEGCDVERCSSCGSQRLSCDCDGDHDRHFARWTGIWPGKAEADFLGTDLNGIYEHGFHKIFFVKPGDGNGEV